MSVTAVNVIAERGKGRPYVILRERSQFEDAAVHLFEALSEKTRVVHLETGIINDSNWSQVGDEFLTVLNSLSLKQASFVVFGASSSIVQHLCLLAPRMVRTVVFIDATTRPHPTLFSRFIDRVERTLPLGLPLRSSIRGFDAKPFLQRIRCPALVVTSLQASAHLQSEAAVMVSSLPTSWHIDLSKGTGNLTLEQLVLDFQDVPAKCPQKNLTLA